MDDYKVLLIPKSEVEEVWKYVKGFVEKALSESPGDVNAKNLYDACIVGDVNLWIAINGKYKVMAALITRFVGYPQKKIIQLNFLAGVEFENYEKIFMETVDGWAKKRGVSTVELIGRKGWERRFSKYGFQYAYSSLRKSI